MKVSEARSRADAVSRRGRNWVDRHDPDSPTGVAIGARRRYRLSHHYHLNAPTTSLLETVLGEGRAHELGSALFAIASALFFGLGFGRVLQLIHARSWQIELPTRQRDQALYAAVLCGVYGLLLLLLVQLTELRGAPAWVGLALALGWIALLVLFFVWAPWLLTHKLVARRDLLPSAALTALGIVWAASLSPALAYRRNLRRVETST